MKELKFDQLITLRDLVKKYPQALDMPIALVGREGLYEFIGEPNLEGNVAKVFMDNHSFEELDDDSPTEETPVLVFATHHAHRDWDLE